MFFQFKTHDITGTITGTGTISLTGTRTITISLMKTITKAGTRKGWILFREKGGCEEEGSLRSEVTSIVLDVDGGDEASHPVQSDASSIGIPMVDHQLHIEETKTLHERQVDKLVDWRLIHEDDSAEGEMAQVTNLTGTTDWPSIGIVGAIWGEADETTITVHHIGTWDMTHP
jgi:hypothetical protein